MSKYVLCVSFHEIALNADDEFLGEYTVKLPHHKYIVNAACESWNKMHMEQYYDGVLAGKITSAVMYPYRDVSGEGKCMVKIEVVLKQGIRMNEKYRASILRQTSAQLVDGWGESFYGYVNVMTVDGQRFMVD